MKSLITVLSMLALTISAEAQLSQIGAITAGGSGCVGSNIRVSVGPTSVVIAYPEFHIQPDLISRVARVNCSIAIPVNVPPGFKLVATASSTGLARLQPADKVTLSQELFLAGSRSTPQVLALTSSNRLFTVGMLKATKTAVTSGCGQDTNLRLNLSATAIKSSATSPSKLDMNKSQISLKLVPCQ